MYQESEHANYLREQYESSHSAYGDYADIDYSTYGLGPEPAPSSGLYGQHDSFIRNPHLEEEHQSPLARNLGAISDDIVQITRHRGLDYGAVALILIRSFVASLATKPFVIFSGLAGAGKTQLATALGRWMGHGHYLLCPVRPDWDTPSSVMGEENPNSQTMNSMHAWTVPRSLELMLDALRHPHDPYLLVFEEMNLAHVEQYFADVLSGMESGHPVIPNLTNDGSGWRLGSTTEKAYLPWPKNLYVIGTVNMDETTYRFSPKVLDRAASIEFRVAPDALRGKYRPINHLERTNQQLLDVFLERTQTEAPNWEYADRMANALQALHHMLYDVDAEFGHRSFRESLRFGAMLSDTGERDVRVALDYAVLYKVLPRFDNEEHPREIVLRTLATFALYGTAKSELINPLETQHTSPVLPRSYAKITRVLRRLAYG